MFKYFEGYRMKADRYILRQRVVTHAREHGIKATARAFGCSRNTIRKWLRRYKPGKPSSLNEESKRPHQCPHQTSAAVEAIVLRHRRESHFGAERLKMEFGLPCGISAIKRILKAQGLVRGKKRKHLTKQDLREVKRNWKVFGQLSSDTKYLQDIPQYWPFMRQLGLPQFQYTVREVVSGTVFTGYADELAKSFNVLLAERVSAHLAYYGLDLTEVEWQTDNGSENLDDADHRGLPSLVRSLGSRHHFIPPKAYTWQSDVETVHRLQEDEFFDIESFASKEEFWRKITTYWLFFNVARRNRHKDWMSPMQILARKRPDLHPGIVFWRPLDLGKLHAHYTPAFNPKGGHDLPVHP